MRNLAATTIVFLSGFAIMVLEIVGVRLLARDFGSSFYVWVSQIGVVLIALALGYYGGGALADWRPRLAVPGGLLLLAGLATGLLPEYAGRLMDAIVQRHPATEEVPLLWRKLDPALGSLAVFGFPCFALATLPPFMIRLTTKKLAQVGRSSGSIIAAGTLGSIAGVFVSGYLLIDHLGMASILRLTGAAIGVLGLACLLMDRWVSHRSLTTLLVLLGWGWTAGQAHSQPVVVFEDDSPYHHISVFDEKGVRTLSFDGSMETQMSLADPLLGHFEYIEYFHMPWLWNGNITNVLMIGLGGASAQRRFAHYHPGVKIETVEIDPMVRRLAKEYFLFQESATQQVHVEDGRVFLRRSKGTYDLIILDAYRTAPYGSFIPYHLATKEFFELASQRLTNQGVLAYNVIGSLLGPQADILGALYQTMKSVFPQVYLFPARQTQNVVLLGTKSPQKVTASLLQQRASWLVQQKRITTPGFRNRVNSFRPEAPLNAGKCPVLTDDFAPVDGLLTSGRRREPRR